MQTELSDQHKRLSSKLTKLSKISLIILGIPISLTVAFQTQFAIWAIFVSLALISFCAYFAVFTVDAYLELDGIRFQGLFGSQRIVKLQDILTIARIRSRKHDYFFFTTALKRFVVISPLSGPGKDALNRMYNEKK